MTMRCQADSIMKVWDEPGFKGATHGYREQIQTLEWTKLLVVWLRPSTIITSFTRDQDQSPTSILLDRARRLSRYPHDLPMGEYLAYCQGIRSQRYKLVERWSHQPGRGSHPARWDRSQLRKRKGRQRRRDSYTLYGDTVLSDRERQVLMIKTCGTRASTMR